MAEGCVINYEGGDIHPGNIVNALVGSFFPEMNKDSILFVYINANSGPGVIGLPDNGLLFVD